MKYVKGQDIEQMTLLPDCVDDYIGEGNPARVFDVFVDGLNQRGYGYQTLCSERDGQTSV